MTDPRICWTIVCSLVALGVLVPCVVVTSARSASLPPEIRYPIDGTRYPPNLAPPGWSWSAGDPGPWNVTVGEGGRGATREVDVPWLQLTPEAWQDVIRGAGEGPVPLRVCTRDGACSESSFYVSPHPLDGTLTYRLVRAPFGSDPLFRTELRRQTAADAQPEPLVDGLPVTPCLGCHAVGPGGGDVAVQVRDPYAPHVGLVDAELAQVRPVELPSGPFGRCSGLGWTPSGELLVAMNLEHTDERRGGGFRLTHHASDVARVDPTTGAWELIPGASEPAVVEDFPSASPDGKTLAFVRGAELVTDRGALDVYVVALEGDGEARPLPGASGDGRASYFPRYSPDGRWIAFVRSDGGYFARPSSDLFLVPASGGDARRLSVNTSGRMDSWPSWSLDGHWLVWASRRDDSPNTRVFFTEIDPTGGCSPPVPFPGHVPEGMSVNHPTISSFPRPAKLLVD